jgi:predicted DNA-binding transcriptional regulator YafY
LVLREGEWYLTGEHQARIAVFPLTDIRAVTLHNGSFVPDIAVRDILSHSDFLQALPHFQCIDDAISTFSTKTLQPNKRIMK